MTDHQRGGLGKAYAIGFEFAAAVGGFVALGLAADWYYDTSPWGVLIGAALGIIGGMYNLIRQALSAIRSQESEESGERNQGQ